MGTAKDDPRAVHPQRTWGPGDAKLAAAYVQVSQAHAKVAAAQAELAAREVKFAEALRRLDKVIEEILVSGHA